MQEEFQQQKIYIKREHLAALLHIAPSKDTRYYLNGVKVEATPKSTILVVTTGHVLGATFAYDSGNEVVLKEDETAVEFIIPYDVCKQLVKEKKVDILTIERKGTKTWGVSFYGQSLTFEQVNGTFPQWRRVIPAKVTGEFTSHINQSLVTPFLKAAKEMNVKDHKVYVTPNENSCASVVFDNMKDDFYGIIMPRKTDDNTLNKCRYAPSWCVGSV